MLANGDTSLYLLLIPVAVVIAVTVGLAAWYKQRTGRSNASNRRPSESMSNAFCPPTDNDGYMLPVRTVGSHGITRDAAGVRESTVSAYTHGPKLGDEQHVYSSIDDPSDAQCDRNNDDIDFNRTQNSAVANIDDSHLDETASENHNTANVYDTLERNLDSQTDNHYLSPTF
ncbi:uncharacterized protein LOC131944834 [Physella acuta]|uniref:uncharacterized protein LOC131944834 n=1 Tax=Physella acuta TaxID=109671 RepID=UPI0027DE7C8F|nr:uncharacterized protein LOC131944834 [Physella acuta]